jgi:hypothetical protein
MNKPKIPEISVPNPISAPTGAGTLGTSQLSRFRGGMMKALNANFGSQPNMKRTAFGGENANG